MFDKLLIPVDGSDPARRAAKYGLELAIKYDASVDILHVIEKGIFSIQVSEAEMKEHGSAILEGVMELDIDGTPSIETHLTDGVPSKVIIEHVADNDIDLVVMGRHGRTGVSEHLLGTVTERVLRSVDIPVLTVASGKIGKTTGRTYESILLLTDGSEVAERAAPYGGDLTQRTGGTLHLLSVVDVQTEAGPFDAGGVSEDYIEQLKNKRREALDRFAERIAPTDIDLQRTLVKGLASPEIKKYADENDIDLIVMTSQGVTNLVGQYIGSTTRRILQAVERPILVIPTPD